MRRIDPRAPWLPARDYFIGVTAKPNNLGPHHYGCAFEDTQTHVGERLELLLLIHMLATLLAWLGDIASQARHEICFKLSLLRQGWEQLRRTQQCLTDIKRPTWPQLRNLMAAHASGA